MENKIMVILAGALVGAALALLQGCGDRRRPDPDAGTEPTDSGSMITDSGTMPEDAAIADSGRPVEDAGTDAGVTCADPYVGDLLRGETTSVYYIGTDGNRYVFPRDLEYLTWFADFSGVRMVTDAEIAAIMIRGNAHIRPGTRLIKIMTDPAVYAVTPCGIIREIESEILAAQLYGADWADRVDDIPDAFFVNYTIGSAITTPVHPDGQLIRYAGDANVYLMEDGRKRLVSSRAFADSGFRLEHAIETAIVYPDGPAYDCAEPLYQEVVCVTCGCPSP